MDENKWASLGLFHPTYRAYQFHGECPPWKELPNQVLKNADLNWPSTWIPINLLEQQWTMQEMSRFPVPLRIQIPFPPPFSEDMLVLGRVQPFKFDAGDSKMGQVWLEICVFP